MQTIFWIQLAVTLFMTGLIWFVQVVHYPLFAAVGETGFETYAGRHQHLTGLVVIVPMLIELASAALLVWQPDSPLPTSWALTGLVLLLIVWASTFFLQVPEHAKLAGGFDPEAIQRLVKTNWIRTIAWSARSLLLLVWVARN
jgi:hypothetical protein